MKFPKNSLLGQIEILVQLWPKAMQAYISGSTLKVFFICSVRGHSKQIKFTEVEFPKKISLGSESSNFLESFVPLFLVTSFRDKLYITYFMVAKLVWLGISLNPPTYWRIVTCNWTGIEPTPFQNSASKVAGLQVHTTTP